jgi:hypothetical protein
MAALALAACSTTAAIELWPVEQTQARPLVDVTLIAGATHDDIADTIQTVARAVVSAPGSRVRVIVPSCGPSQPLDETSAELPTHPRAQPRFVERETDRLADRITNALASPLRRPRGVCLAEALAVAASSDALAEADATHIVIASPLVERSRFADLERGRLPTLRTLTRRATAQHLFAPGLLSGIAVHIAAHRPATGASFARSEATDALWLALLDQAGARDVDITTGPPDLDSDLTNTTTDEEE